MKNKKPLLIAGTVTVALIGVSIVSKVTLSNNHSKCYSPKRLNDLYAGV